jgi:hypothetical protein
MSKELFLLLNTALAFYAVGLIWTQDVNVFRPWKLLNYDDFMKVRRAYWKTTPYLVFIPVGLSLIGAITLIWYHPEKVSTNLVYIAVSTHLLIDITTALSWGQWQARIARGKAGPDSLLLDKLVRTHWIRAIMVTIYGVWFLIMEYQLVS